MRPPPHRTARPLAALILGAATLVSTSAPAAEDSLAGRWLGWATHNGEQGSLAIELTENSENGLVASLSLPDLGAWRIASMPARVEQNRLVIGPWELRIESDGTLRGVLPGFLVPVHEIPVVFHRVDRFDEAPPEPIDAPVATPLWTRDLGSPVWAGLAVDGDRLLVGDESGRLSAIDASTGEIRWQVETGGSIRARPSVQAGTLFVHSDDGALYALDPATGRERWHAHISDVRRIPAGADGFRYNEYASGATVADGSVYVGGFDGSVVALALVDGAERWRFAASDTVAGTPAVAGERIFFGSFDGRIYALDRTSGRKIWNFDTGAPVVSSPLVYENLVVVGSRSYDLLALDAATGGEVWKYYYWFSWIESSVSRWGDIGYVGASDGQDLLALDLGTGELLWRFDTQGAAWPQPAVTDEAVFAAALGIADYWAGHRAGFFSVDRETGRPRWQFPQDRSDEAGAWGFAASPAVDESRVFTADLDGRVYAFPQ